MPHEFVKQDKPDTGKKFQQVTKMLDIVRKANGDPVAFDQVCKDAGAKYPQDVQAAMFALELTGLVDRYTYVEDGSTRSHVAYAWVGGDRPTSAASSGSKKRSSSRSSQKKEAPAKA
jgi:hypothetical protein